jgi:hypothetical protein
MSVISNVLPGETGTIEALLLSRARHIQSADGAIAIIPDVVISEVHVDEITVTRHPVDTGSDIADHAFREPSVLNCSFGWSDNSALVNSVLSGSFLKGVTTTQAVYETFLKLLQGFELLDIKTGKREYRNMICTSLRTSSTVDTENALIIDARFEEVITAQALNVTVSSVNMRNASQTSGKTSMGVKTAGYAGTSPLSTWIGG